MSARASETTLLLDQWHAGDRQALGQLLEEHIGWIRDRLRRRMSPKLRARAETMDLVDDALVQFLEHAPRFRMADSAQFRALLARIADNVLTDHHRWWSARRRDLARERPLDAATVLDLENRQPGGATRLEAREREHWVRFGIELLSAEDRAVIVLRDYDGLDFAAIGNRLGLSPDAARMRHARALDRLARLVGNLRRGKAALVLAAESGAEA